MPDERQITLDQTMGIIRGLLDKDEKALALFGSALRSEAEQIEHERNCELSITHVEEHDFGWVFYYNSTSFLDTGDHQYALVGNAPYLVERTTGRVFLAGTGRPTAHFVRPYRKGKRTALEEPESQ